MQNGKYQCNMAACCTHTTNHHLLAAKQEPYQKVYLLTKNIEGFSGKGQENGPVCSKKSRQKEQRE